jgi:hypothetical protein
MPRLPRRQKKRFPHGQAGTQRRFRTADHKENPYDPPTYSHVFSCIPLARTLTISVAHRFTRCGYRIFTSANYSGAANALTTDLKEESEMKSTPTKPKISGKAAPSVIVEGGESDSYPGVEDRLHYLSTAAYYKAEARGFAPGQELDDWLEAETEFDAMEGC